MVERQEAVPRPVASVIIPTQNRRDELVKVLDSVLRQDVPLEVLVMDDGSVDGTPELVRETFPQVRLEVGVTSRGPTYCRNRGAELATTEYLVTLDDDCQLTSADTVARTLEGFDHPRIGAVTIPFINVNSGNGEQVESAAPADDARYITGRFLGGMVAFRRAVYQAVKGYRESFFMHIEEGDLAIRMLAAGYVIRLGSAPPLHHHQSPVRNRHRIRLLGPRNQILYAWHNVPMPYLPAHMLGITFKGIRHGWKLGHPIASAAGFARGYLDIFRYLRLRRPVPLATYRLHRRMLVNGAATLDSVKEQLPA